MSTVSIPNPTLSDIPDKTEIEGNFEGILNGINGNLDDDNLVNGGITASSKLDKYDQEFAVDLEYNEAVQGVWPAASSTPLVIVPLPGISGDTIRATGYSWLCTDVGTADAAFDLVLGYYDASGNWTAGTTLVSGRTIDSTNNNAGIAGNASLDTSITVGNGADTNPMALALISNTVGTGVLTTVGSFLRITVRFERALQ